MRWIRFLICLVARGVICLVARAESAALLFNLRMLFKFSPREGRPSSENALRQSVCWACCTFRFHSQICQALTAFCQNFLTWLVTGMLDQTKDKRGAEELFCNSRSGSLIVRARLEFRNSWGLRIWLWGSGFRLLALDTIVKIWLGCKFGT